ncbi:MAG: hypothetical protein RRC34_09025 [Lentisphaeria bacterium]|nr:hypothetical protein [Lentisphaeria bacterium]
MLSSCDLFPELWRHLHAMRAKDRIAHAYLLVGDDEAVLRAAARDWAATIVCMMPVNGAPCGTCDACASFATGAYREWNELKPISKSRQILVDDMREFESKISLTPAKGFRKIGVIFEADRLNVNAQNAFLKTLEEPPGNLVLLLVTTQPQRLLPTIRSRCQLLTWRLNKQTFDVLESVDIIPALIPMKRGAGAAVALRSAAVLKHAFKQLMDLAKQKEPEIDQDLQAVADQDPALKKRLVEQRENNIKAEYVRLKTQLCGVIETWFHQRFSHVKKTGKNSPPNPELTHPESTGDIGSVLDARADADEALKLTRGLAGNLDEALAIEAFCLTVCKKNP